MTQAGAPAQCSCTHRPAKAARRIPPVATHPPTRTTAARAAGFGNPKGEGGGVLLLAPESPLNIAFGLGLVELCEGGAVSGSPSPRYSCSRCARRQAIPRPSRAPRTRGQVRLKRGESVGRRGGQKKPFAFRWPARPRVVAFLLPCRKCIAASLGGEAPFGVVSPRLLPTSFNSEGRQGRCWGWRMRRWAATALAYSSLRVLVRCALCVLIGGPWIG